MTNRKVAREIVRLATLDHDAGGYTICGMDEILENRIAQALYARDAELADIATYHGQIKDRLLECEAILKAVATRHDWHAGMGECTCSQHTEARAYLKKYLE